MVGCVRCRNSLYSGNEPWWIGCSESGRERWNQIRKEEEIKMQFRFGLIKTKESKGRFRKREKKKKKKIKAVHSPKLEPLLGAATTVKHTFSRVSFVFFFSYLHLRFTYFNKTVCERERERQANKRKRKHYVENGNRKSLKQRIKQKNKKIKETNEKTTKAQHKQQTRQHSATTLPSVFLFFFFILTF